ncbi:MAG: ECF transporter S component [Eubacteriales bacterium]
MFRFTMSNTKRLIFAALCVALGVVLPIAFHSIANAGSILLPMHIPVLLCGLVCGWPFGAACGVLTPLLSSLFTGMPPVAMLPSMLAELAVYGLVSGLLMQKIKTGKILVDVYLSLIAAMPAGRFVFGILNALIFRAGSYSFPSG